MRKNVRRKAHGTEEEEMNGMGLLNDLKNPKPPEGLVKVNVLGVRTAEETKVMATYNSTIYCCLLLFSDGHRELIETDGNGMKRYLAFIDV